MNAPDLTPIERAPYTALFEERFGIPPSTFDRFTFFRPNRREVAIVPTATVIPPAPQTAAAGMPLLQVDMRFPKPTAAAAMRFGALACRNLVDLPPAPAHAFARRATVPMPADQRERCTSTGYVIVCSDGIVLGVGFYHERSDTLESFIPKAWALP